MFKYLTALILIFIIIFLKLKDEIYNYKTITFGASLPKTGIMKEWGKNVYVGANAYFNYVNDINLLNDNKKIKFISLDDKYEPELTKENMNKLLNKNDLFGFFGFVGTPTVKNILPILEENKIPFIAPFTGASFLRDEYKENFINFRSSYKEEIDKIVDYLIKKRKISKIAVFYQNDTFGEEGYISLIEALNERKLKLHGEGMYKRNTLSIKHAFSEIKEKKPEAIIMVGAYKPNALFIKKAKNDKDLQNVVFCNISFSGSDQIIKELDFEAKNMIFSQVVPTFTNNDIDVIKEYRYLMKRYFPREPLGFISLESFLAAKTVIKALNEIKGILTKEKFLEEMKNLKEDTLQGIKINYKNTQLLNEVYLFKYENTRFVELKND